MLIQTKKSGKPRRVIDLKPLNKYAVRQSHPLESPFLTASSVPPETYRMTCDAWNGYHSIPLKEEDRHYTTFMTPFGHYRYKTAPQGFLAAGDGFCHRFDDITKDVEKLKRCVDDSCTWENSIKELFYQHVGILH